MTSNNPFSGDQGKRGDRVASRAGRGPNEGAAQDPELEQVLRDFRTSVHAWSEAVYQRPRLVEVAPRRMAWRKAAAWALGSVLVAGGVGGGLLEYQHQREQARIAAAREAQHQRQIQAERARQAEEELASVDSDISRQVPDALEPLAQLMTTDESQ
jgi:hypothetical protein